MSTGAAGPQRVLVTGANSGLGYDACRQLALKGVPHITLACRSQAKAEAACIKLVADTGVDPTVFGIAILDTSDLASCRAAAEAVAEPLDAVVLNAGGMVGGRGPTAEGVTGMFAVNVLGHVALVEALLARRLLAAGAAVAFAGSETSRGNPKMKMARPANVEPTADNMDGWITGDAYDPYKPDDAFSYDKLMGALYMGAMARRHEEVYWITISPGLTGGTKGWGAVYGECCGACLQCCLIPILKCCGIMHGLEDGAARYVLAVTDAEFRRTYPSGTFVATADPNSATGAIGSQAEIWDVFGDHAFQDAAYEAIHRHLPQ